MEELLRKINWMKRKNEILNLKNEINEKNKKMKYIKKNSRKIIQSHSNQTEKLIENLNSKIKNLEKERDFYKNTLNSMPKLIVKIFSKKIKMIEERKK